VKGDFFIFYEKTDSNLRMNANLRITRILKLGAETNLRYVFHVMRYANLFPHRVFLTI